VIAADFPEHMPELDLALNTGLRLGEMYHLTWEDVDLARRMVTVQHSKNGDSRHVRLNQQALAALGKLLGRREPLGQYS